jgi:hypothetical protein
MTPPPTNIDGIEITGATIDGQEVEEITIDGQTVFTSGIIDDFEDGNLTEYSGDTGDFSVSGGTVHSGSFALSISADIAGEIFRTDFGATGKTFEYYMRTDDFSEFHLGSGTNPGSNGYLFQFFQPGSELSIINQSTGNTLFKGTFISNMSGSTFYRIVIDYKVNGNDITVTAFDGATQVATTTVTDSTSNPKGIAFSGGARNSLGTFFDDVVIL